MKVQEHCDFEEDILEDPIKIVFETDKVIDNKSVEVEMRKLEPVLKVGKNSRVDLKEKSEANTWQSSKPLITTFQSNYEIKQAIIKIIDCNKYPSCYTNYNEQQLKKRNEVTNEINSKRRNTKTNNMQPNAIEPDIECENNNNENTKEISDISVKIKYDSNKKVWIVENKQDSVMRKNDMEVRKAINQRNLNMIDFKRNTGLVGLTVKQKLMVSGENITHNVKKLSIEKSRSIECTNMTILGGNKYNSHEKNKKYIKCTNSQSKKYTMEPKSCVNKKKTKTELNNEDTNTQIVNLTRDTKINHEQKSDQLVSNFTKNYSNNLISQNDLGPQKIVIKKVLDKPQTLKPTTNITHERPAPKCKKNVQEKPEINADIDKALDKTVETHNIPTGSSLIKLDSNKPELESKGVVNEMSKGNIMKLSPREQRNTNISFQLPNCKDEEISNQFGSNITKNCQNILRLQNDLGSQKLLDKPHTLEPTTNIIYERPAPKCKKMIQEKPEINADIDKTSNKTVETHNVQAASSLIELDSYKPEPQSKGVVDEISKINIINLSPREQINTNFSFRLPNCKDQEISNQFGSNIINNCQKTLIMQNDLGSQILLDKPQTLKRTTNIIYERPAPKCKKMIQEKPEINADIDKTSNKTVETHNVQAASSLIELDSYKPEPQSKGVVDEISKINIINLSPREQINTNFSFRLPNCKDQEISNQFGSNIINNCQKTLIMQNDLGSQILLDKPQTLKRTTNIIYERPAPKCKKMIHEIVEINVDSDQTSNKTVKTHNVPTASSLIELNSNKPEPQSKGVVNEISNIKIINLSPTEQRNTDFSFLLPNCKDQEISNQLVSNFTKNCPKTLITQNDLGPENLIITNLLDKPQTLKPTTNIISERPVSKCKTTIQEKPEINADIDKISHKTFETHNVSNASSLIELHSNKPEPESKKVVNAISKINIIKCSPREQRNTNFSVRLPNDNSQYKDLPTAYYNGISHIRHRLPIHRPPATNRFHLCNNLSYRRYNSPSVMQNFSWQQNLYNIPNNYGFNDVYRPHATFARSPPPRYPFNVPPVRRPPPHSPNAAFLHCGSRNDTRNAEHTKNVFIPTFTNTCKLTKNNTIHSYSSNAMVPINYQGASTIAQNNIKKAIEVAIEKPLLHNNSNVSKRSCNINNIVDQESEPLTKKTKLEKLLNIESEDVSKTKEDISQTEYSPPILPIPSYQTILTLLKSREMVSVKTKYWQNSDEDTDASKYVDEQHKFTKHESKTVENKELDKFMKHDSDTVEKHVSDTENVLNNNNTHKAKKISLQEYKRRASLK